MADKSAIEQRIAAWTGTADAAFTNALLREPVMAIEEVACKSRGDPFCQFVVTPPAGN